MLRQCEGEPAKGCIEYNLGSAVLSEFQPGQSAERLKFDRPKPRGIPLHLGVQVAGAIRRHLLAPGAQEQAN